MSHDRAAFRCGEALRCAKCEAARDPKKAASMDERRVIKRDSLLGKACVGCGVEFLDGPGPDPLAEQRRFRQKWAEDVRAGKAWPIAGDLFDQGGTK